jgi:hypothetical protein
MYNGSTILPIVNKIVGHKQCFTRLNCYVLIVTNTSDQTLKSSTEASACIFSVYYRLEIRKVKGPLEMFHWWNGKL